MGTQVSYLPRPGALAAHEVDLDAHMFNPLQLFKTGELIWSSGSYSTLVTRAMVVNTLYAMQFFVGRTMTFDRIACQVVTADAGKSIRLGIYNNGINLYPGTLVLDAGTVSTTATGVKLITISQQLTRGLYWVAAVSDGAPSMKATLVTAPVTGIDATDFSNLGGSYKVAFSYAALPDPFTAGGVNPADFTIMIPLRLLTLD